MKIVQFRCEFDLPASQLKQVMVYWVNTWSRLQRLADDPDYLTEPFSMAMWHTKVDDPFTFWVDWDAVYTQLGDDGRRIADQMLGTGPMQGILRLAPLVLALPSVKLQVVDVADPVAAGYLAAPEPGL